MNSDELFMREALTEARQGIGKTFPNPAVGAVVVKNGRLLARGWHRAAGRPHAEVEALHPLSPRQSRGATLYVTLEPCSTTGRTPPCTEAIIRAGISRVVYGTKDPNPHHAGRAAKILRHAGVSVTETCLAPECAALNADWNKWITTGLPYVVAKAGFTLDGRIASPPGRRWITSPAARHDVMRLRATMQAIMVGGETVRVDNPRLTVRGVQVKEQPWRAVWTRSGNLPARAHLFTDAQRHRTVVFQNISLKKALHELGRHGVMRVLLEGGAGLLGEAFDRNLVDEVCFYLAPVLSGGPTPVTGGKGVADHHTAPRLAEVTCRRIGPDVRMCGKMVRDAARPHRCA